MIKRDPRLRGDDRKVKCVNKNNYMAEEQINKTESPELKEKKYAGNLHEAQLGDKRALNNPAFGGAGADLTLHEVGQALNGAGEEEQAQTDAEEENEDGGGRTEYNDQEEVNEESQEEVARQLAWQAGRERIKTEIKNKAKQEIKKVAKKEVKQVLKKKLAEIILKSWQFWVVVGVAVLVIGVIFIIIYLYNNPCQALSLFLGINSIFGLTCPVGS